MLEVNSNLNRKPRGKVVFHMIVSLTLPSGICYCYLFKVTSSYDVRAYPTVYFMDHATESGWYLLEMTCILNLGHPGASSGTESFHFDPPGGTEGTDPGQCYIIV